MYNEVLKLRYLYESTGRYQNIVNYMTNQFSKVESTELRLGKDLCNFHTEEITDYYRLLCTPSLDYLVAINSQFKMYTAWCQSQNLVLDNQNHYEEIDASVMSTCINYGLARQRIVTREELMSHVSNLLNPSDIFLCIALFDGICGKACEELLALYPSDFDGKVVKLCSGRVLDASPELTQYARLSSHTYDYYTYNDNGNPKDACYDVSDSRVLKRFRNATGGIAEQNNIYRKLVRIKTITGCEAMTSGLLQESGRLYTIKSTMQQYDISLEECVKTHKEIEYRYGKIHSLQTYIKKYRHELYGD